MARWPRDRAGRPCHRNAGRDQTRQANNLNQIAKHLNQGTLVVDPDLEADLKRAVAEVAWMRTKLMEALGVLA
ncbi:plasmid mobilization relaxosome protein MobC [Phaeobacter inhibens]|uniref:plasmid mobilization relaxosome protein MobC n=1 Tax=Phaeobacter inhibens TaxID=221822 RepID=UPI000C9A567F|nr:plasmid mobilization relaxosome protein MobC [Phaeobacter inhibens]